MNDKPAAGPPPSLTLADIYYILFRHKWKIGLIAGVGLLGALLLPLAWPRPYQSEAKVFIRYVLENRSPNQLTTTDSKVKTPDERGENVINTELEILTSLDLSVAVAKEVGPDKILAKLGGGSDLHKAAAVVRRNLLPDVPKKSNVIRLIYQHPDASVVEPVLTKLISLYLEKHAEIHRSMGVFDNFLESETDELRRSLGATEDSLRQAKTNAQIISVEDSKKLFSDQMARVQQAIFDAEAELAERQAAVAELSKLLHVEMEAATNAAASTNALSAEAPVGADKLADYKRVAGLLESLQKREQDLLVQFTAETSLVKGVKAQIVEAERRKHELETENPGLLATKIAEPKGSPAPAGPRMDLITEAARVSALNSKIRVLNTQMAQIRRQATVVDAAEGTITSLQRKKDLQEAQYRYFQANLEQTKFDKTLGAGRVSNINVIQAPSPPFRDSSKLQKAMAMLVLGALAAGLAFAFVTEMYFDRSIRRSNEIEPKLGLPLFLTIPHLNLNGKARRLKGVREVPLLADRKNGKPGRGRLEAEGLRPENGDKTSEVRGQGSEVGNDAGVKSPSPGGEGRGEGGIGNLQESEVAVESQLPNSKLLNSQTPKLPTVLHPFYEALRDRLILYFEVKNLTHKPKLVAVTSCAPGSGVSTAASGLAATLSETGDGNVLLVDMNFAGEAHQFYRGKLACDLDDALAQDKRSNALVQENLYVVSETGNSDKLPRVLPNRFKHLVPKLKASDYDYIIFDLPPISQISATPKLARFMDMVFVVVESEKTACDVVKRATGLLAGSSNVGIILNKARTYVPKQLQQEL